MFKHLSLQEKIELLLGTRTSGGGLPLPEAFGAVLSHLHDKGNTSDDVLKKVIREKRQVEFREPRILEVCDDWDSFCQVILDALEERDYIRKQEGSWSLTEKAVPGKELTVLRIEDRRARVRFFGEDQRQRRNDVEVFKNEIDKLTARISGLTYLNPGTAEMINQYLLACSQAARDALIGQGSVREDFPLPAPEIHLGRNQGVARWYRNWVHTAGWHTQIEAWRAWNKEFPERAYRDASLCPTRNAAQVLVKSGEMEKREVEVFRDNAHTEYRYIGGSVLSGN